MGACPRCHGPLTYGAHSGWTANGCHQCGGVWLDSHTAQGVLGPLADLTPSAGTPGERMNCPSCGSAMGARYTAVAGVEIDECTPHGAWFDHDELVQISAAVSQLRGAALPPGHREYARWGPAPVLAAGAVGLASVPEEHQRRASEVAGEALEFVAHADVGATAELAGHTVGMAVDGVSTAVEGSSVLAEGAAELAGGALEVAGSALEGVFAIVGGILEGLG